MTGDYSTYHETSYSAVFIDIENIYYYLKNCGVSEPDAIVYELVRRTREWLHEQRREPSLVMIGYADFDQVDISLGDLYLMGVEPRTVVSTEYKNAADMRLCIDALEILYTRPDIQTFVNEYGVHYPEVWLTPFLRRLNEEFPLLANHERRALIANLVAAGAIRVERREGNPYPYSVAIINWDHPTVHEVNEPQE